MKTKVHPLEIFEDGRHSKGHFTEAEFLKARALLWAAPELLEALEIIRDSDGNKEDMREMAYAAIQKLNGNPLYNPAVLKKAAKEMA